MPDVVPVRRALLSVSDKTGLIEFARELTDRGVEIISTGGTARALQEAGLPVTPVEQVTGVPEMLGGRVKTLHPKIHGALLALRDDPEHQNDAAEHDIEPIDLVCINLYPFEQTIAQRGVGEREAIEQIDIGGPAMIRSAAKNYDAVAVITSPGQYERVIHELSANAGATTRAMRADLAASAFARTSEYDAAIASHLGRESAPAFPDALRIHGAKVGDLRYGENPHQAAALYRDAASTGASIVDARQVRGKALGYNNIADASAALELVRDLNAVEPKRASAAVVKHANPCGAAVADSCETAASEALAGDSTAAFGGILVLNRRLDRAAAETIADNAGFLEVIAAPSIADEAAQLLGDRWANARLLTLSGGWDAPPGGLEHRSIPGGVLMQQADRLTADTDRWSLAAGPAPENQRLAEAVVIWTVVKHLKSNAVAIGGGAESGEACRLFGTGGGLVDRVTACEVAIAKAGDRAKGAIAASDAFFPFSDGPQRLIDAGVSMIVQPGGSKRDQETLDLCAERGVTCLLTGVRCFRH